MTVDGLSTIRTLFDREKFASLLIQEVIETMVDRCVDLEEGNIFGGEDGRRLFDSLTVNYDSGRSYAPSLLLNHLVEIVKRKFGV